MQFMVIIYVFPFRHNTNKLGKRRAGRRSERTRERQRTRAYNIQKFKTNHKQQHGGRKLSKKLCAQRAVATIRTGLVRHTTEPTIFNIHYGMAIWVNHSTSFRGPIANTPASKIVVLILLSCNNLITTNLPYGFQIFFQHRNHPSVSVSFPYY